MQINPIQGINPVQAIEPTQRIRPVVETVSQPVQPPGTTFKEVLEGMVGTVSDLQTTADKSIQQLATGENKGLHEVVLAVEKASISFQFLTQVRNKAVEAYQEVMRMPV